MSETPDGQAARRQARKERVAAKQTKRSEEVTKAKQHEQDIIEKLSELGGRRALDTSIKFGEGFTLPKEYEDNIDGAVTYLDDYVTSQEQETEFSRTFMRRPWDGAVCMVNAMHKAFGTAGRQRSTGMFFWTQPPEMRTITVNAEGDTVQVPWGRMDMPLFHGTIHCGMTAHRTYGALFHLSVIAAKKFSPQVEGFFRLIEEECKNNSIYQGKAIDGQSEPEFIDPYTIDAEKIIFSQDVWTQLRANLWSPLEHAELHRELGLPLERKVLLKGPYGTGKTMATGRTMQVAVENDWTAMVCRPGRDDLDKVMQTARLYQPCVVVVEDVDAVVSTGEQDAVARLLDLFDGVQAKGVEVIGVMTTNHIDRIHKAMLRPGRLDAVIEIGGLDREGVARMVMSLIKPEMLDNVDFDKVYEAMESYPPAFCKEAIDRAVRYAIDRENGRPDTITTTDLVEAAHGLRAQYEQMTNAGEGTKLDPLGKQVGNIVSEALSKAGVTMNSDGWTYDDETEAQIAPITAEVPTN